MVQSRHSYQQHVCATSAGCACRSIDQCGLRRRHFGSPYWRIPLLRLTQELACDCRALGVFLICLTRRAERTDFAARLHHAQNGIARDHPDDVRAPSCPYSSSDMLRGTVGTSWLIPSAACSPLSVSRIATCATLSCAAFSKNHPMNASHSPEVH